MAGLKYLALFLIASLGLTACEDTPTTDANPDQASAPDAAIDMQTSVQDVAPTEADMGRMGRRPEQLPTEGTPDLPGADDLTAAVIPGQVRAGRVDRDEEKLTGPEANCRVGDFRLDNSVVSLCIQAETTFSNFSFYGGNIVDAHRADRPGTDMLREIVMAPGIGEVTVEEIGILKDGSDGLAIIQTSGRAQGALIIQGVLPNAFVPPDFKVTTEYRLRPDTNQVDVWTWIHADRGAGGSLTGLDFVYFGDRTRMFKPLHSPDGVGPPMTFIAADAKDVSYAWEANGEEFTLFILAAIGIPGAPVQLGHFVFEPDDMQLLQRTLTIGTGDIESLRPAPENAVEVVVRGIAGTEVDIETPDELAITRVRLDANGEGRVALVPGNYGAHTHGFVGGDVERPFTAAQGTIVDLDQPEPATLTVTAVDAEGRPLAVRTDLSGPAKRRMFVVDEETAKIPAGEWTVVSSRGWHYNIDQQSITLAPGQTGTIQVTLTEVIPLEGWASGEFHQHASPSLDSEAPVELRVLSNLVEGVDFMVPSDHDIIYDYAGLIERMGLSHRITAPLTGEEVSPRFTHLGVYGIPYDAHAGAGGAVRLPLKEGNEWRMKTIPELIEDVRARGARAIQVNHPRASQGYFDHVGYEPHVPLESLDHHEFSPDFDSLEVYNSASDFCRVLADWLGLLNQGLRVTAVGNSDTHSAKTAVGYPRNYLPTLSPDRVGVTADEIVAALEEGTLTVGGGAMMDFPEGPHPGETLSVDEDTVSIRVRIRTPAHLKVDRLIAFVNGIPAVDQPIESTSEDIVDLDEEIIVPNTADGHVVFLALSDDRLQFIRPGQPVFAMANPIWLDRNGDGIVPVGPGPLDLLQMPYCD